MTKDVKGKSSKGKISNLYGVNASEEIELKILVDTLEVCYKKLNKFKYGGFSSIEKL